ncbi:unnamed protein product [Camellia sinensis]
MDQLFSFGELANYIWTHYHQIVGIQIPGNKICAKLQNCWARASPDNAMGIIRLFLQCLVCWDIWKEQSGGVSEGTCSN